MKSSKLFKVTFKTKHDKSSDKNIWSWDVVYNTNFAYVASNSLLECAEYVNDNLDEFSNLSSLKRGEKITGIEKIEEWNSEIYIPEEMTINVKVCGCEGNLL